MRWPLTLGLMRLLGEGVHDTGVVSGIDLPVCQGVVVSKYLLIVLPALTGQQAARRYHDLDADNWLHMRTEGEEKSILYEVRPLPVSCICVRQSLGKGQILMSAMTCCWHCLIIISPEEI